MSVEAATSLKSGHLQWRIDELEQRLAAATAKRDEKQLKLKKCRDELSRLFKHCPSKPRETMNEIEERARKLERERTIVSISLTSEKMILRQINKLERVKSKVSEWQSADDKIKQKKEEIAELRRDVGLLNSEISSIRLELSPVKTANELGCKVEELLGMKVALPEEKLGQVIGKQGKNLHQLRNAANVDIDIHRRPSGDNSGEVRIIGSMTSLDLALSNLEKVVSKVDETVTVSTSVVQYLTTKGITALSDLRQLHMDVRIDVQRNTNGIRISGIPADLESFKQDMMALAESLDQQILSVSSKESALIVGKQGATVDSLVLSHQVAIDIQRSNDELSAITIIGPGGHVESALREVHEMLEANRDVERNIPIDKYMKQTLMMDSGKGIQEISQKVNEVINDKTAGFVNVNFADSEQIVVKGKSRIIDKAVETIEGELRRLDKDVVRISIDPSAIPGVIGKGGQGVKALRGDRAVNIEFDRETGQMILSGLSPVDLQAVVEEAKAIVAQNQVERIKLESEQYKALIGDFIRTKSKDVGALVHLNGDDERMEIVLRGTQSNIHAAIVIVKDFLDSNYIEELEVSEEDIKALLSGGKSSKIVDLSDECGVRLSCEKDRQVIFARGEKGKVVEALKKLRSFLFGGEGSRLAKIALDSEVLGMIIGKGGKNKADLEAKYPALSIIVHRNDNVVSLRGPEGEVEKCRLDILKQVAAARVTHKVSVAAKIENELLQSKAHLRLMNTIPVSISMDNGVITIRGSKPDVRDAAGAIDELVGKTYSVGYYLDMQLFRRVSDSWKDPASLQRIVKESGANVSIDTGKQAILFSGERKRVVTAKLKVLKFLDFLFANQYCRMDVSSPVLFSLGKAGLVADAVALSGATIILDRDLDAVLIFAPDPGKLEIAKGVVQSSIDREDKLVSHIKLDESEDWLVALILGKNGSRIKALRKETGCKIDVESHKRQLTISGDDGASVAHTKVSIMDIIERARRENVFVSLPESHMAAFVGRSGVHITEFSKAHGVEVQTMKKGSSMVRLTGPDEAVRAAKNALQEWIASRENRNKEEESTSSITLRRDQIPKVIGNKGAVIRSLEKDYGCKIEVDRKTFIVSVSGAQRTEAIERIRAIATEVATSEVSPEMASNGLDRSKSSDDDNKRPRGKGPSPRRDTEKTDVVIPPIEVPIESTDFPTLHNKNPVAHQIGGGLSSWAAMLKGNLKEE